MKEMMEMMEMKEMMEMREMMEKLRLAVNGGKMMNTGRVNARVNHGSGEEDDD